MSRTKAETVQGFLVIDKPAGLTSHDVVSQLRKLTGVRRIGHAGTLDPFATGVLVVAVGRATRLLRFVSGARKRYLAQIVLGVETDTGDLEGAIIQHDQCANWPVARRVDGVLAMFIGDIQQTPPAFSAIRISGKRAYELARAGEEVDMPVRNVRIQGIRRLAYEPPQLWIDVECGAGTYIRALAADIGRALGTYGYCHQLRRTQVGHFSIAQSWTLNELESMKLVDDWQSVALAPASALRDQPAIILTSDELSHWVHGRSFVVNCSPGTAEEDLRVYSCDGGFVGIGRLEAEERLQPAIVFNA